MPAILAKSVSSLPRPTFSPGKNRVPRWRTRIEPPLTSCPPKRLTPRRCEFESRPLREEPCPFLCAMVLGSFDSVDADFDHRLPVPLGPAVLLRALFLEDEHLARLDRAEHRRLDGDALGLLQLLALMAADEHDLGQADFLPLRGVALRRLDSKDVSGSDLHLFSARADDGIHQSEAPQKRNCGFYCLRRKSQVAGVRLAQLG